MKIMLFSDLHYFAGDMETAIFNTKRKLVKYALPMLDRFTEMVNEEYKADFAVNLGDTIQDTTDHDRDIEALKFIFGRLKRINCPCYSVLGNHDLKMMDSVEEVESIMGYKSTYSFDFDGWHLVFLSPEVRPELGIERGGCYKAQYLAEETLLWLDADLKKNKLPCLIFTHYGVAEDETISDGCMFMKNRNELKEILTRSNRVKAVFSGHQHITRQHKENGIDYYVLSSMINDSSENDDPDGSYILIETDGENLKVTNNRIGKAELKL